MDNYKLSICIPTYNRGSYLTVTLDSIIKQIRSNNNENFVQICISDNFSEDDTSSIVEKIKNENKDVNIKYSANNENMGADKNYLKVVSMADGDYCWLFGSDDCLAPSALDKVLDEIQENHDIYLFSRIECSVDLKPIRTYAPMISTEDEIYDFRNKDTVIKYLQNCKSIYGMFSYLSAIVLKRSKWNTIKYDEEMTGTAYSHAFMLLSILKQGGVLKNCVAPVVYCRMDNDSFATEGEYKRFMIDIKGYGKIIEKIADDLEEKNLYYKVIRKTHSWKKLIKIKLINARGWNMDKILYATAGYSKIELFLVETLTYFPVISKLLIIMVRASRNVILSK